MSDVPLQFVWRVAEGGYGWVESHPVFEADQQRQPFLTDGRPTGAAGFRVRPYLPLAEYPGLFRVFADTEPSCEGVKAFADRFGPLGPDIAERIALHEQPNAKSTPVGSGEPLAGWRNEILMMNYAVGIWEPARAGNVDHS